MKINVMVILKRGMIWKKKIVDLSCRFYGVRSTEDVPRLLASVSGFKCVVLNEAFAFAGSSLFIRE